MNNWHYIVIGASLLLLAFCLWQEYRRRNKKFLTLRIAAIFIAVVTFACIALPITVNHRIPAMDKAILLTEGYSTDSVNRFTEQENKNIATLTTDAFIASTNNYKALHVFGYGLSKDELQSLHNTPVIFHPSAIGTGITAANWKQTLQTGEKLRVQGSFNNTSAAPVKLLLNGLNTFLDSVTIPTNTQQQFELSTVPKQAGKAVYNITALANNKVIEDEPVPVEVVPADSLKVLILAASPDFENRFIKNWLSQNACQVAIRTATSKDKYDKEFLNTPSINFDRITPALLSAFDVLISDASAFSALGRDEQNIIQSKVEDGLGLIIKTDTTLPAPAFYTSLFPVYATQAKREQAALKVTGGDTLHAPQAEQQLYIRNQPGTQAIITGPASQIVVNSAIYGAGKIVVTAFTDTYGWMLTGDKDSYYSFWSALLDKAVKKKSTGESVNFSPAVARINQRLYTTFTNTGNALPQPVIGESNVYLNQGITLPFEWDGSYWPVQTGWQAINTQTNTGSLYVYGTDDWKYITAIEKINATKQYVLLQNNTPANTAGVSTTEKTPVPKIYFFIAVMVCCTFLWVEKKFNG